MIIKNHTFLAIYSQPVQLYQYCVVDFIQTNPGLVSVHKVSRVPSYPPNMHSILLKVILKSVGLGSFSFSDANDLH